MSPFSPEFFFHEPAKITTYYITNYKYYQTIETRHKTGLSHGKYDRNDWPCLWTAEFWIINSDLFWFFSTCWQDWQKNVSYSTKITLWWLWVATNTWLVPYWPPVLDVWCVDSVVVVTVSCAFSLFSKSHTGWGCVISSTPQHTLRQSPQKDTLLPQSNNQPMSKGGSTVR